MLVAISRPFTAGLATRRVGPGSSLTVTVDIILFVLVVALVLSLRRVLLRTASARAEHHFLDSPARFEQDSEFALRRVWGYVHEEERAALGEFLLLLALRVLLLGY